MSFSGAARVPRTPTLPQGETVASYGTYLEAQRAVDHLSDKQFPVQLVTIVGTELKMVERVTGRLTYARVAMGGFGSGAWFGLFIGLLFLLTSDNAGILLISVLIGGGFGLLFSVIIYSFTGGKRDFTSQSQIVASQYAVLCQLAKAGEARQLLRELGGVRTGGAVAAPVAAVPVGRPSDPAAAYPPAPAGPPAGTPPEQPRYGQLAPQPPAAGAPDVPRAGQPRYGQYAPSAAPVAPPTGPEQPGPATQPGTATQPGPATPSDPEQAGPSEPEASQQD